MTPYDFRKIRALDHASLHAKKARREIREAYAADPNIERRRKLDEVMVALPTDGGKCSSQSRRLGWW